MFRDTYVRADDRETIIHEYTVQATLDADSGVILTRARRRGCCLGRNARAPSTAPLASSE